MFFTFIVFARIHVVPHTIKVKKILLLLFFFGKNCKIQIVIFLKQFYKTDSVLPPFLMLGKNSFDARFDIKLYHLKRGRKKQVYKTLLFHKHSHKYKLINSSLTADGVNMPRSVKRSVM